ncbi:MAG: ATP-binding protein, partial [Actinomycetota bacterium]|nr:ATP-binding protein [Actinomycetota bacterium]
DEAWAILSNLAVARWLQSSWKLARAWGVANIAVLHRVSDLTASGAEGSEHQQLARGLLADSETRVVYGQAPGEIDAARHLLGLSPTEAELVPQLGRGVALWKVGGRSFVVRHLVGRSEADLVGTDDRMQAAVR